MNQTGAGASRPQREDGVWHLPPRAPGPMDGFVPGGEVPLHGTAGAFN